MRKVRTELLLGSAAQTALLALLAATGGLSPAGWVAGLAFGAVVSALLTRALARSGAPGLGPANRVTLTRATLVGGIAALVASSFARPVPLATLTVLTVVALVLDNVDGRVARRTRSESAIGARFDMEVDAFLILVLSAYLARPIGVWVLAIGAARYAFGLAGLAWPVLRQPVPPRPWRKVVAAIQGVTLATVAAGILPVPAARIGLVVAAVLLAESFGRDVWWLVGRNVPAERPRRLWPARG